MGGKRFRWIYYQLGQLALLSLAAFVAACALATPGGAKLSLAHHRLLETADLSIVTWIPMQVMALLLLARNRHKRRTLRESHYETFVPLFVASACILLTGFYGIFVDSVVLKNNHPDFGLGNAELLQVGVTTLVLGLIGTALGSVLRNRTAFLALFGAIGASSLYATLTRECLVNPNAAWYRIGCDEVSRFAGIGMLAFGIALGIFVREVTRYRRRSRRARNSRGATSSAPAGTT